MNEYLEGVKAAAGFGVLLITALLTLGLPILLLVAIPVTYGAWWLLLTIPGAALCFTLLGGLVVYLVDSW